MASLKEKPYIDAEWLELFQEARELGMTSQEIRDFLQQFVNECSAKSSTFEDIGKR
ncbi:anti-repressor SinI family protein [Virgibacillus senegalensis]|uniref:anti-repressor SinI family protein n=1 Tax=Virgibacillus senegalensis TaxID=1499679 RepID=UPI0018FE1047|nr:anti-repressor SinI family protein [Virgibacillus senegalensis]